MSYCGAVDEKFAEYVAAHEALRRFLLRDQENLSPEVRAVLNRAGVASEQLREE